MYACESTHVPGAQGGQKSMSFGSLGTGVMDGWDHSVSAGN